MNEESRTDLYLDFLNAIKKISDDECILYLVQQDKEVDYGYKGNLLDISNALLTMMLENYEFFEIIDASMSNFLELTVFCKHCNTHQQRDKVDGACPSCGGKLKA